MTRERPTKIDARQIRQASQELQAIAEMGMGGTPDDPGAVVWSRFMTPELGMAVGYLLEIMSVDNIALDEHLGHGHCHSRNCAQAAAQVVADKIFEEMKMRGPTA